MFERVELFSTHEPLVRKNSMTGATYVNQQQESPTKGRQADIQITDEMIEAGARKS
jgi:hypothetical protein